MLLSENKKNVDALKFILENHCYLEYDEKCSKDQDYLKVRIDRSYLTRKSSIVRNICLELEKATDKHFHVINDSHTFPYFNIRLAPLNFIGKRGMQ